MNNVVKMQVGKHSVLMEKFVGSLAASYPTYTFTFVSLGRVDVTAGSELIGEMWIDRMLGDDCNWVEQVVLNNRNINRVKCRGKGMKTKDLKKATRLFAQYFKPRDVEDVMESCVRVADSTLGKIRRQTDIKFYEGIANIIKAGRVGRLATALDGLVDMSEMQTTVDTSSKLGTDGVHVCLHGDMYLVKYLADPNGVVHKFTADTLPQNLRANLAMLKLVDDLTIIADRGVRVNESSFMILEDTND
jgi:hypothetical protein